MHFLNFAVVAFLSTASSFTICPTRVLRGTSSLANRHYLENRLQSEPGFGSENTIDDGTTQLDQMAIYQQQLQVWQQQMAAFAQFNAANPEAASQMKMPPPPTPPNFAQPAAGESITPAPSPLEDLTTLNPKEFIPKGSGNKDAYEITNPADVYLAQLKRDSAVRSEARKKGDMETANKPFEDFGVKAIGSILSEELIASRREQLAQNGGEFETSRDEMIIPYAEEEDTRNSNYTGISYRQKLMEKKKRKTIDQEAASEPGVAEVAPVVVPEPTLVPLEAEQAPSINPDPNEEEEEKPNFALPVQTEAELTPILAPSMEDSEETRRSIRNLMGLILKQRGGPGFGAGRLKEAEATRLENNASEITALLKLETGIDTTPSPTTVEKKQVDLPVPKLDREPSSIIGAIACVQAAATMYLDADAVSQDDLIVTVRDALASALDTLDDELKNRSTYNVAPQQHPPPSEPVFATTMEFPDTFQVAKSEIEPEIASDIPIDVKSTQSEATLVEAASSVDSNSAALKDIYKTLKSVAGDQKFGLGNVSSDDASNIKDALVEMRGLLMDELDSGIPAK